MRTSRCECLVSFLGFIHDAERPLRKLLRRYKANRIPMQCVYAGLHIMLFTYIFHHPLKSVYQNPPLRQRETGARTDI